MPEKINIIILAAYYIFSYNNANSKKKTKKTKKSIAAKAIENFT